MIDSYPTSPPPLGNPPYAFALRPRFSSRFQPSRIGIQRFKERDTTGLGLVLQLARSQSLGKAVPKAIEPGVGHLQHPADVRRLVLVEKRITFAGVAINTVAALKKPKRDKCVQ